MTLQISKHWVPLRVILLEVDGADLHKDLQLVANEDVASNRNIAVRCLVLERDLGLDTENERSASL